MEKGGEKAVKPIIGFLFIILLIMASVTFITVISQSVSAQSATNTCCVTPSGCFDTPSAALTQQGCTDTYSGTIKTTACSQLSECIFGYCCYPTGAVYQNNNSCAATKFIPASRADDGTLLCDPSTSIISGKIKYNDGTPAKANIIFTNETTGETKLEYTATTDDSGNYILYAKKDKEYKILATRNVNGPDPNCQTTTDLTVTGDTTLDLALPCTAESVCQMKWVTSPWSNPQEQCGTRNVTLAANNNGCNSGVPAKPAESRLPCITPNNFVCNPNGALDAGEPCDPGISGASQIFSSNSNQCSDYISGTQGTVTCTNQCIVDTSACVSCPTNPDDCSLNQCTTCSTECVNAPICAGTCQDKTKVTLDGSRIAKELKVNLTWNIESTPSCAGTPLKFILDRCLAENEQCTGTGLKTITTMGPTIRQYLDADTLLKTGKEYCYNLTAEMNGAMDNYNVSSNQLFCIKMPDTECLNRDAGRFCNKDATGNAVISQCKDSGKFTLDTDKCQDACVGPDINGDVRCIDTNICTSCNGPFGVFGYTDNMYLASGFGDSNMDCHAAAFEPDGEQAGICYLDEASVTNSAIGQYKACSDVWTCYDYKTRSSCSDDPCMISLAKNCNWKPILSNASDESDTGLGVCVPKNPGFQDCTQCDSNSPLGVCTPTICSLYGEEGKCNYNPSPNPSKPITDAFFCMDKAKMSCNSYKTQNDCVGPDNKEFKADISYDNNEIIKGTSTNDIIQRSHDKYGFGTCRWIDSGNNDGTGSCYKDADMNNDTSNDDCSPKDLRCLTDFQYPKTNISLINGQEYSTAEISGMTYTINDTYSRNDGTSRDVKTYFSIEPKETNQKYARPATELKDIENIMPTQPGDYVLYYFSKDPSNNYEPVKNISFTLIKDLSGIKVTKKIDSAYIEGPDVFLSNLTITAKYDSQITCRSTLTPIINTSREMLGNDAKSGTEINFNYTLLEDGDYNLLVECTDSHLQKFSYKETITIEADTTIKNPTPRGITVLPGGITISINTSENATCYYLNDKTFTPPKNPLSGTIDGKWTEFKTTGQKHHETNVTKNKLSFEVYFTACKFNYTSPTPVSFIGNYGDMIYFGVDNESPRLKIIDDDTHKEYNSTSVKQSVNLKFECNDTTQELLLSSGTINKDLDFGCDTMSYCKYYSLEDGTGCTPSNIINITDPWKSTFGVESGKTKIYLNISVADKGGNTRNYENVLLNIKNTTFIPPNITICNDALSCANN